MENQEMEKCAPVEDGSHLNRNRSFKSKQLVRSQAIRESTSPPRTVSPSVRNDAVSENATKPANVNKVNVKVTAVERTASDSSHDSDVFSYRKPVEIQITQGSWDENPVYEHRRTKRWLSDSSRDSTRDLLSNNPRVACVCGACAACPHCRGRRRRHICTIKQDSGICPDECTECSDSEPNGVNNDNRKTSSLDVDDQYYCRCPDRREKPKNMLSRTDSEDKSEPSGPELVAFIKETLNKNGKDRMTLLKIEKELHSLVNDVGRCVVKFPVMTSYGRMLVHRCAALFQLSHHLDHSNKNCVIVSKSGTSGGRIPCTNFKTWCVMNFPPPSPQRHPPDHTIDGANAKSILKRDTHSLDEPAGGPLAMNRSKSLEQREKEYERVRRRIFSTDNCNQEESQWPWLSVGPVKLLTPEIGRNKLLKVQSLENSAPPQNWRGRGGVVSKSHSFGGYGEPLPTTRALSRQGDLASSSWRLSPSSSGYKTLSLRSTDSVTPSPTGGGTPEPPAGRAWPGAVVWAVTDMACVPPGALVLHPQTGRPLSNPDGSVYHFDPTNPPVLYDPGEYDEMEQPKIEQNNEKRRGRLEKQHSFIDHEAECQQTDQYHYEYEVHDSQENPTEKEIPKPATPTKTYEPIQEFTPSEAPTNQTTEAQPETNQSLALEARSFEPTKQKEPKAGSYQDTVYYGPYASLNQGYSEEVVSPPQVNQYMQPDVPNMQNIQNVIPQAKVTPIIQDPNIRPMSLAGVVYPPNVPTGYQYIPSHTQCRVEPLQQQLYQPMLQHQIEEHKIPTPPQHAPDTTFRIDPSYPYAPVDYTAAYGACVDPTHQTQPHPQRSYSVPYNPAELSGMSGAMPPVYPLGNVIPPMMQYPVQYPEVVPWPQMQSPLQCPVVYPQHYAHYNILYPQVLPQHYPICQPIYPIIDNRRKRNSLPSARLTPLTTPITTPEEKPYEKFDRQNSEIAVKINQIKEGMMQRENPLQRNRREDWKRNSGSGILGSYPVNNFNRSIAGGTDNVQLTSAARAIVNSIRHLQAKNTYHQQERRYDYNNSYQRNYEYRRRYEDRNEINGKGDGNTNDRHYNYQDTSLNKQDRTATTDLNIERTTNSTDRNYNYQDRSPNKQDRTATTDLNIERTTNSTDRYCNYQDRSPNKQDRTATTDPNIDRTTNSTDRNTNNQYRHNYQDKSNQDSNNQDRSISSTQEKKQDNTELSKDTQDKIVQERQSNAQDSSGNVTDRIVQSNVQDRTERNFQDRSYQDRNNGQDYRYHQDRGNQQDRPWQDRKYGPRQGVTGHYQYRPPYLFRQMSPGTWCRRSPAPVHPGINHPRRPQPDNRNGRRY